MTEKRTMTLNLSEAELRVLGELAAKKDTSRTAVSRQALRVCQIIHARVATGERLFFEVTQARKKAEVVVL
jgi:hypothetical protein